MNADKIQILILLCMTTRIIIIDLLNNGKAIKARIRHGLSGISEGISYMHPGLFHVHQSSYRYY